MGNLARDTLNALAALPSRLSAALKRVMKRVGAVIGRSLQVAMFSMLYPLVFIVKFGWLKHLPCERRLRRRMKGCGRYMGEAAVAEACAAGRGTLIWDLPTSAAVTISRLWWTDDEIHPKPHDTAPDPVASSRKSSESRTVHSVRSPPGS